MPSGRPPVISERFTKAKKLRKDRNDPWVKLQEDRTKAEKATPPKLSGQKATFQTFWKKNSEHPYPHHLAPIGELCERIAKGEGNLRYTISCPPQHGKTETLLMFALYCMINKPGINIIYVTYSDTFAKTLEKRTRRILAHGFNLSQEEISSTFPVMNTETWVHTNGSVLYWTSKGGIITGLSSNLTICDDLIASSEEAGSNAHKKKDWEWFYSGIETRARNGSNVIVNATRWSEDDLIGKLHSPEFDYTHINLQAVSTDSNGQEQALWPQFFPLELLHKKQKMNEAVFSTMYQGNPVSHGMLLFNQNPTYYTQLPTELTISLGVDMSYSANGSDSDYSVIAVLGKHKPTHHVYLLDLYRVQMTPSKFGAVLKSYQDKHQAPYYFHTGPAEKGIVDLLTQNHSLRFKDMQARSDKFARAQDFADCWNREEFLISRSVPNHLPFLQEIQDFTASGRSRRRDDCIDAISSAFFAFSNHKGATIKGMKPSLYYSLIF